VNLPPKTSGGSAGKNKKDNPEEKEKEKKIQLSITLTSKGIYVASASGVLSGDETASEDAASPTVPLTPDGKNDLKALKEKLIEIKTKIKGQNFKDDNTITITAESEVFLQDVIDIMDIVMIYEDTDGEAKELFPKVQFGKVI
jgi:biopolymer transport protein ExbD